MYQSRQHNDFAKRLQIVFMIVAWEVREADSKWIEDGDPEQ